MLLAKTHILVGKWMKATGQVLHGEIIQHYEQSIKLCPSYDNELYFIIETIIMFYFIFRLEKGHFFLASYYDTFIANIPLQSSQSRTKHIPRIHLKVFISFIFSSNNH